MNRIKSKADSTLRNMPKNELIDEIRILEHNYKVQLDINDNIIDMNTRLIALLNSSGVYEIIDVRGNKDE